MVAGNVSDQEGFADLEVREAESGNQMFLGDRLVELILPWIGPAVAK